MKNVITDLVNKYGIIAILGVIGAIINLLRKKMNWRRFAASVVISIFVALCFGVICRDWIGLPETVVYVVCGLCGCFADTILDEVAEIISKGAEYVEMFVKKILDKF